MPVMIVTNQDSGTNIGEIADRIFRINTPLTLPDGGTFSFNQYLVAAERPLLFHTGPRQIFPLVREAVERIIPVETLRYVAFAHFEADECGALNDWLQVAPEAVPVCGVIGAMVSVDDLALRSPHVLKDGETLDLGGAVVQWFDAPHVPHGWDNGFLYEQVTGTLFCGDLFTQPGHGEVVLTEEDILGPSEAFRQQMDYYAHAPNTRAVLERLATTKPRTLACMHGSAWRGDGGLLILKLADSLTA
jgi:flavorubredoxin